MELVLVIVFMYICVLYSLAKIFRVYNNSLKK